MKIGDFFPPLVMNLARTLLGGRRKYSTYEEALTDCTAHGYEHQDLVNVILTKTQRYKEDIQNQQTLSLSSTNAFSLCSLLVSAGSQETNVIDFGGACGAHYFLARALLPPSHRLRWVVVETPEMVRKAEPLLTSEELSFSTSLFEAAALLRRVDLLHTSGTLQCVDKPYDYLKSMVAVSAGHILFNRLGLTKGNHDVITVHESLLSWNGPGAMPTGIQDREVRYPFVFVRESVFRSIVEENYDVVMTFDDKSGMYPVGREPIIGIGLLARARAGVIGRAG